MGRIYQIVDPTRLRGRRESEPDGRVLEVWPDVFEPETCWLAETSWLVLKPSTDPPPVRRVVDGDRVAVIFPADVVAGDSMPDLDAVRTRTLARHGIAAFWVPPGETGPQITETAVGPQDLFFFLKRAGAPHAHLWRLLRSRYDARGFLARRYPGDPRVEGWVASLPFEDYEALAAAGGTDGS